MLRVLALFLALGFSVGLALAQDGSYRLSPGDMLEISIWKDDNMRRKVVVLPDGTISYPLAGHFRVAGMTVQEVEAKLVEKLKQGRYYKDVTITVSVMEARGNEIFVIGEVNNPGAFTARRQIDVMQALSLAGGLTEFADETDIVVLRRSQNGQESFPFDYSAVQSGRKLSSNILLQSGDTVVVPAGGIF